ncbi:MAG: amidohydrolase family protein [Gemmatimonadota bacterium]
MTTSRGTRREARRLTHGPTLRGASLWRQLGYAAIVGLLGIALLLSWRVTHSERDIIALTHANVVDVEAGAVLPGHTVLIKGSRIQEVGSTATMNLPRGALVYDLEGMYVIPGLWDSHVHLTPRSMAATTNFFPLLIANGVTTIRDMGTGLEPLLHWRREIDAGRIVGPRIFGAGVLLDGAPSVYPGISWEIETVEEARAAVDSLARSGADFVKAYEMLAEDVYFAILGQAALRGLKVATHIPLRVDAIEAVHGGIQSVEHLRNLEVACSGEADAIRREADNLISATRLGVGMDLRADIHAKQWPWAQETFDPRECAGLVTAFAQYKTWHVPTLVIYDNSRTRFHPQFGTWMNYMPIELQERWLAAARVEDGAPYEPQPHPANHAWAERMVQELSKAGVRILAGTDAPTAFVVPGFSLHQELQALVGAGLTALDALRSATLWPAEFFGVRYSLGSVAAGQTADLVILRANPLTDIRNTETIEAIVANGRILSRADLDGMLRDIAAVLR